MFSIDCKRRRYRSVGFVQDQQHTSESASDTSEEDDDGIVGDALLLARRDHLGNLVREVVALWQVDDAEDQHRDRGQRDQHRAEPADQEHQHVHPPSDGRHNGRAVITTNGNLIFRRVRL